MGLGEAWVVGVGQAGSAPARDDVNTTELAWEAISAALDDAGVELGEIEGAVTASQDFWEGRTISSMAVNEVAGGTLGSEAKVAADGVMALLYAMARIEDGDQRLNLVVAHAKESQADPHGVELAAFDPYYERPLDPDETVAAALQADLYYRRAGLGPADAALVVAAARRRSGVLDEITAAQVLASPATSDPLHELDRAPRMDAATCLVVCDTATKDRRRLPGARLVAGAAQSGPWWTARDLTAAPELAAAAHQALRLAGWERDSLTRIELNAPFAHQQLLLAEALGLGSGPELVERFEDDDGTRSPRINADGGWLGGSAGSVAGLAAAAAATSELRDRGGRALVHGSTGLCAQSHAVVLLGDR
jgi:acetyl-CoA C-acetyltransferase